MLRLAGRYRHDDDDRHGDAGPAGPKEAAVGRWVARRLKRVDHERRVASIASHLFDLTRDRHRLGVADRRLLRLACLVHDVGRCVSRADHPAEGARLILDDAALPLTAAERRVLAYLTTNHRDGVPAAGGDDATLDRGAAPGRARLLLGFLRAADALDSRSLESPRLVFARAGAGDCPRPRATPLTLKVHCYLRADSPKARKVYRRRKKFRLLEELLDCTVDVEIAHAQALRMVA